MENTSPYMDIEQGKEPQPGLSGLERLVSRISFEKEKVVLHILPGLFLMVSLPVYASLVFIAMFHGVQSLAGTWYSSLAALYVGYILSSSYSSYRLLSLLHKHLVDSGITSYYWLKKMNDEDTIRKLYRAVFIRRNIPSPITGLVLSLFTGGIAYPILLYIIDRILRDHCYGEEKTFLNTTFTSRLNVEYGLLYIAATILTIGIFLVVWDWLIIKNYNKHLSLIHGNHPEPPSYVAVYRAMPSHETSDFPVLAVGLALLGIGIYGALSLLGLPCYLPLTIGYGLLIASVSARKRFGNVFSQILHVYAFIYLSFIMMTILGFAAAPTYSYLYDVFRKQIEESISYNLPVLIRNIFFNNLAISLVSSSPIIGPMYLGVGIGNAGLAYGIILNTAVATGRDHGVFFLPIMPHAILELLAYALFAALSTRITHEKTSHTIALFLAALATLFLAAVIESFTILIEH